MVSLRHHCRRRCCHYHYCCCLRPWAWAVMWQKCRLRGRKKRRSRGATHRHHLATSAGRLLGESRRRATGWSSSRRGVAIRLAAGRALRRDWNGMEGLARACGCRWPVMGGARQRKATQGYPQSQARAVGSRARLGRSVGRVKKVARGSMAVNGAMNGENRSVNTRLEPFLLVSKDDSFNRAGGRFQSDSRPLGKH